MSSAISVFIKNMAGDLTLLEVPTGTKVEDMPSRLTELDREAYPPYRTRVFRLKEEDEKDTVLKEEDILSVLILDQPEPETGVFPQGGKPYTRCVLQVGDKTVYLYLMSWGVSRLFRQSDFAISFSPEVTKPSTTFISEGMCLYDMVHNVIPDITPSQMKNLYDVVNPYYEKLGYLHRYNPQEPIECECGSIVKRSSMPGHKKTKNHIALMKSN